jgi:hypothetical protein
MAIVANRQGAPFELSKLKLCTIDQGDALLFHDTYFSKG